MLGISRKCSYCGQEMESTASECPHCGEENNNPIIKKEKMVAFYPWWKQIAFFGTGWVFLNLFALFATGVLSLLGAGSAIINYTIYIVTFGVMLLVIWDDYHPLLKSFKSWKPYVFGIAGLIVILIAEGLWGTFTSIIFFLMKIESGVNANETAVRNVVISSPFMSLIVFGIIGPICEELTYRVGIFSFFRRIHIVLAYFLSIVFFAFIHFDHGSVFAYFLHMNDEKSYLYFCDMIVELLNLPMYMFAGAVFTFLYHKFGFAGSFVCHATNNMLGNLLTHLRKLLE